MPSSRDIPNPGIEPRSSIMPADSLQSELPRKSNCFQNHHHLVSSPFSYEVEKANLLSSIFLMR